MKKYSPLKGTEHIKDIKFEKIYEWSVSGNDFERFKTIYKNIVIYWTVKNFFALRPNKHIFEACIIIPINFKYENITVVNTYEPDGFGCPQSDKLIDIINFIDNNTELVSNKNLISF